MSGYNQNNQNHNYPPNLGSPPSFEDYSSGGLASPRTPGFQQQYSDQSQGYQGLASGPPSSPLPRYSNSQPQMYSPTMKNEGLSPLNPAAGGVRPGYTNSSPTLGEGEIQEVPSEKGGYQGVPSSTKIVPVSATPSVNPLPYQAPQTDFNSGRSVPVNFSGNNNHSALEKTYRRMSGTAFGGDSGKDARHQKYAPNSPGRLGYLDGVKFIAAWVVLNGTLFDATLSDQDYTVIQRSSPLYITRSTNLGIVFFLLLEGRCLIAPLWDIPPPRALNTPPSDDPKVQAAQRPSISWPRLTRAMLVRPFRFILPVIAISALQWGLASGGKLSNCNAVGMDEPYWYMIKNFAGYATLVFDLFTYFEYDTLAGQTFSGNLWTNPWLFQASYCCYVVHMMLGNLSSNRYWVYAILCFFSWCTYNFFFVALLGVLIADLAAHGHLKRIQKLPIIQQTAFHIVLIAISVVTQFVGPIRSHLNSGMATINVEDHPEISFADSIFAFCWIMILETSGVMQMIFGNVAMRWLGRLAPGIYLLAAPLTFSIIPDLALSLHNGGSKASTILGLSWLVLFVACVGLAIPFHFAVELPSKLAGELFANFIEEWGVEEEKTKHIRNTLVRPKHEISKPNPASRVLS